MNIELCTSLQGSDYQPGKYSPLLLTCPRKRIYSHGMVQPRKRICFKE